MSFFNYMTELFIKIMTGIMYVAPIGVFCLMADATGTFGYSVLMKILYLIVLYVVVLAIITYGMIGGSVAMFSKCTTYKKFFQSMWKVQLFAFSTASSMATLPLNMNTTMTELGVSKETTSFALPLGATINMNGNAAYYAMAATFIAQMYGMDLSFAQYVAIIITSTLGAVGQAGVPGPTLLVVAVLVSANIPIDALPILFGVDRIFDMLRTAVNITGDAACATIVDQFREDA
jgi:Na+/H+-dicarboxylate symporter